MSERFGTLRSILQKTPSEAVWREIVDELGLWGEEVRDAVALTYVLDHLDRWPEAVVRRVEGREPWWAWGLANTLHGPSPAMLERIAASEGARRVRRISMHSVEAHGDIVGRLEGLRAYTLQLYADEPLELWRLLGARWPESLRELRVYPVHGELRGDDAAHAIQLAQNASLSGLEVLELSELKIREEGVRALAESAWLTGLRELRLGWNEIGDGGVRALAASANMAGVTALELAGEELHGGLAALLGSPHLAALRKLELAHVSISAAGAQALRDVAGPPALEEISLGPGRLTPAVMEALAEAPVLRAVRSLSLDQRDEARASARLLASPHLTGLRELRMSGRQEEAVLMALAQSAALAGLGALYIEGCELGERVCEALAGSAWAAGLRVLSLRGCSGDVVGLLERGAWGALRVVFIAGSGEQVGDAGAARLAACEALRGVAQLNLSGAQIGDAGASALVASPHLSGLRELSLNANLIGDAGAAALVEGLAGLTSLSLGANRIGDAGAAALAASPLLGESLGHLSKNQIGDAGMLALVRSPHLGPHSPLDLSDNLISDAGLLALAREPALARLEGKLSFDSPHTSDDALRALAASPLARDRLRSSISSALYNRRTR